MPLAKVFQNNNSLIQRVDDRIGDLRQEYYGRLIDENDDKVQMLEDILHLLRDPELYNEMHQNGLGNHTIVENLRIIGVIEDAEAISMVKKLRSKRTPKGNIVCKIN